MKTLTVRMADRDYDELTSIAASRGMTLSELARDTLGKLSKREPDPDGRRPGETPETLNAVTRHQLALLHRILAHLVNEDSGEEGDRDFQVARARVLEKGYVAEYDDEFLAIEPELTRRESAWVMDVLDMFECLEWSYEALTDAERATLGEGAGHRVAFSGFDMNDRLESRLLGYAQHLIDEGKWASLAKYFDHDHGNSHSRRYDVYDRMLEVFLPIWKVKLQEGARTFDRDVYQLDVDQIGRILAGRVHPSRR